MLRVVDPYTYRDRYTMPKLILNSTGDQFFATDSSRFYYADLPGPKWLRYAPNTDHKQSEDVIIEALSWIDDILDNKTSPQIIWALEDNGILRSCGRRLIPRPGIFGWRRLARSGPVRY